MAIHRHCESSPNPELPHKCSGNSGSELQSLSAIVHMSWETWRTTILRRPEPAYAERRAHLGLQAGASPECQTSSVPKIRCLYVPHIQQPPWRLPESYRGHAFHLSSHSGAPDTAACTLSSTQDVPGSLRPQLALKLWRPGSPVAQHLLPTPLLPGGNPELVHLHTPDPRCVALRSSSLRICQ